jgi:hypothetical protein
MHAWKKYTALPSFRNCALQAFDTKIFRNVVKKVLTLRFISYGLSTPDVLPNFPVRCLRLHRVLMFNELKQKRRDCQWIVAWFGYTVVRTATEMTAEFLNSLNSYLVGYSSKYSVTGYPENIVDFLPLPGKGWKSGYCCLFPYVYKPLFI